MRRREFIVGATALLPWSAGLAQRAASVAQIGVLMLARADEVIE